MTAIKIIEQEMERNPNNWKDIAAQRIESAYRNKGAVNVKEYDFTFTSVVIITSVFAIGLIIIGMTILL